MKNIIVSVIVSLCVALSITAFVNSKKSDTVITQRSAFDTVVASKTLRCAYAAYDPFLVKNADGNITGIFHDVLEEAGKRLGFKIVWAEEVGYGNINTGFNTGRYDAFCAGLWPAGTRAANTIFSRPVAWDPVGVWVRQDDTRFNELSALNDPAYKISAIEGDATAAMADALYPQAGRIIMSQNQTIGEEIAQVTSKKADALFQDYLSADRFLKDSPGSLKNLSPDKPALIYPLTIGFNQGEISLKNMVDVVLSDMERDGTIAAIIKKYLGDKANLLFYQRTEFQPYQ